MKRLLPLFVVPSLLALTGCGAAEASGGDRLRVSAAFYPLQWVSERVGGDHVDVEVLTKPGAEPHDLELTPRDVGGMASADVVVYLRGFQPAVDVAVANEAVDAGFDVSPGADLTVPASSDGHDHAGESDEAHAEHDDAPADAADGADPHFWLDPVRLEKVATAIGERFAAVDPANAADYRANAAALVDDLDALDAEFRSGLADCRSDELVTGHVAFAYLAQRYGLTQEGVAGISPDSEPTAAALRELAARVEEHGVRTVYGETLVSPALAETLARETGATVAVLDPVEGLTDSSAGSDYLEVMRSNLRVLEEGQQCR